MTTTAIPLGRTDASAVWLELLETMGVPFAVADRHGALLRQSSATTVLLDDAEVGPLLTAAVNEVASAWGPPPGKARMLRSARGVPALGVVISTSPVRVLVVLDRYRHRVRPILPDRYRGLTAREREVAALLASPLTTREIAARLGITVHTTRRHTEAVFRKLQVRSRVAVAEVVLRLSGAADGSVLADLASA
jgi:DNA-binding CsgD family transcriptional regulator